jgi:2-polyprenyl-6-methoxyphenol hydroxylase-like FAD-dependent oxidoreductase
VRAVLDDCGHIEADLIVVADGVHSYVRTAVGLPATKRYLGQMYWRFISNLPPGHPDGEWRVWQGGPRFFGLVPISTQLAHGFLQLHVQRPFRISGQRAVREALRAAVRDLGTEIANVFAGLRIPGRVHLGPAWGVDAPEWVADRVALVGDAAHSASPLMSQGAGMALEDALVLAEEVRTHGLGPEALRAYAVRRMPRVAHVKRLSELQLRILNSGLTARQPAPFPAADERASSALRWMQTLYGALRRPA